MWKEAVDSFVYDTLGMSGRAAGALDFFIYDTVKIFLLLAVIIFFVTFLRSFFPTEKVREYLSGKHPLFGHVFAALFGIITPFS